MGVSFDEIQFPADISQGALGGMGFNTSVQTLTSGAEKRNQNWTQSRGKWDVKHGLKTQEQLEALIDFFAARKGRARGFRFKDWLDYRVPRWRNAPGDMFAVPVMFITDGVTNTFQVTKVYADSSGQSYQRIIRKPVYRTDQLLQNGTPMTYADYNIDYTTGIIGLSSALTMTTGVSIAAAMEFDVPVRFDIDNMQASITTTEIYAWEAIPVVEIRDIN